VDLFVPSLQTTADATATSASAMSRAGSESRKRKRKHKKAAIKKRRKKQKYVRRTCESDGTLTHIATNLQTGTSGGAIDTHVLCSTTSRNDRFR